MRTLERCYGQWGRRSHQLCPLLHGWGGSGVILGTSLRLMCRHEHAACQAVGRSRVEGGRQNTKHMEQTHSGFLSASNQVWPGAPLSTSWCSRTWKRPSREYLQLIAADRAAALCLSPVFSFSSFPSLKPIRLHSYQSSAPTGLPQIYYFWFHRGASFLTIPSYWMGPGEQDRSEPPAPSKL